MAIPKVDIQGKVFLPDGSSTAAGTIEATLSAPGSALDGATSHQVAGKTVGQIATDGTVTLSLVPNDAITPSGTCYRVKMRFGSIVVDEIWQLASSPSPIDVGAVPRLDSVAGIAASLQLATASLAGVVKLAGDLGGTAAAPTVVGPTHLSGALPAAVDAGSAQVTATGSTTARAVKDIAAEALNVKAFGAKCDGATDDTAAVQAILAQMGSVPKSLVVDGPCVVSSNLVIPAIFPVRREGNGGFIGSGIVTYRPADGQAGMTVRRLTGDLLVDYAWGTFTQRGTATGASVTQDAVKGAQKLTWSSATVGQYVSVVADGTWDLSASDSFAIDVGHDRADVLTGVSVWFSSDTTYTSFANYSYSANLQAGQIHLSRGTIRFTKAGLTVGAGSINWAAVKHVEIRFVRTTNLTNAPVALYLYGLWSTVSTRPKVLVQFDDGYASVYTDAFPRMAAAGMRGTLYVRASLANLGGPTLTMPQLQALYAAGWDLGNHSWSHQAETKLISSYTRSATTATMVFVNDHGYTAGVSQITIAGCDQDEYNGTFTVATTPDSKTITFTVAGVEPDTTARGYYYIAADAGMVRSEIRRARDWLLANGWTRAADHVAYPGGARDRASIAILRDEFGVKTGRTVGPNNGGTYESDTTNGLRSPYDLPSYELKNTTTAAATLAEVDSAISTGSSLIMFGHDLVASSPSSIQVLASEFQGIIDGLKSRRDAGQLDVVTISEWFDRL